MQVPFRLLDVFAEAPFSGNQLCVVPEVPDGLDAATMLTLAREIGFSETTFVTATRDDGYDVRIFTPDGELAFAGHPTLGTAFALVADGRVAPSLVQSSAAGEVPVEVDLEADERRCVSCRRCSRPSRTTRAVAAGAGLVLDRSRRDLPVVSVSTGIAHLMVPVRDEATLRRAERDARAVTPHARRPTPSRSTCSRCGRRRRDGADVRPVARRSGRTPPPVRPPVRSAPTCLDHGLAGMPGR